MEKIIFFDVDGTLINFNGELQPSTIEALERTKKKGNKIIICTGRTMYQIQREVREYADGYVASTGAYVEYQGKKIYENFMSEEALSKVVEVMEWAQAELSGSGEDFMIMTPAYRDILAERFSKYPPKVIEEFMEKGIVSDGNWDISKVKRFNYEDSKKSIAQVRERLKDYCEVAGTSFEETESESGEIVCKGITKSHGMKILLEYLGKSREDSVAIGDGPNDLDMLEYAGLGIAMGNAREELIKKADYVTADIQEDGLYLAMEKFGLI